MFTHIHTDFSTELHSSSHCHSHLYQN